MTKKLKFTWDEFFDSVNGDFENIDSKILKGYINPKNKIIKKPNKSHRTWYTNLIVGIFCFKHLKKIQMRKIIFAFFEEKN